MAIVRGVPCKRNHDGRRYMPGGGCVQCALESSRRRAATPEGREKKRMAYWKEGGKENRRARNLKANYGISVGQYDAMNAEQIFSCAICGEPPSQKYPKLVVDHCHATGAIRALLCHTCNLGLGAFKDNPAFLESAISYLRRFGKL